MSNNLPLKKEGIYDFEAAEDYGFELEEYLNGCFESMVMKKNYIEQYINLRKAFQKNDRITLQSISHSLKATLPNIGSSDAGEPMGNLNDALKNGVEDIDDLYVESIYKMFEFYEALVEFCKLANKPISEKVIEEFKKKNEECEKDESPKIKEKLYHRRNGITVDKDVQNTCCIDNGCIIL
ncbi:MAG: hypothetical protein MJ252_25950 [archaeon]|nr:hypothetical protein [archaeon]